ncbi:ABC transporter ATP-binding protein [Paenibacillus polymyxa]|uniref:ABC transporter ATP-binding protein n=1 Tax=Paenibacillus polymyxa TaxID=1406 RepID=UPI000F92D213
MKNELFRFATIQSIFPLLKGVKNFFVFLLILSGVSVGLTFLTPLVYQVLIDRVIVEGEMSQFVWVAAGYLGILFATAVVSYLNNYCNNRLNNHLLFKVRNKILGDAFRKESLIRDQETVAEIKMNMEDDTNSLKDFLDKQVINYLILIVNFLVAGVLLFLISWPMALVAAITIPATLYFDYIVSMREKEVVERNRFNDQEMTSWFHTSLENWREIKALGLQRYEKKNYLKFLNKYAKNHTWMINFFVIRCLVIPWVKEKVVMQLLIYFIGGIFIIQGKLTIGMLLVFIQYYLIISNAIVTFSATNADLRAQIPILERIKNKLAIRIEPKTLRPTEKSNELSLNDVGFRYLEGGHKVLRDVNMTISKGDRIVIYGKSGEGKSTLIKLMAGILKPTTGEVCLSGIPIQGINEKYLYQKIGLVLQDTLLFDMSIAEYLYMISPKATQQEIESACKSALMYDFIMNLPDGFGTVIGENGTTLSGGQKQRLILAGQLLKGSDILILDEATNHLDQQSEDLIYEVLKQLDSDKTIIYITHRPSKVKFSNKHFLVEAGVVSEQQYQSYSEYVSVEQGRQLT